MKWTGESGNLFRGSRAMIVPPSCEEVLGFSTDTLDLTTHDSTHQGQRPCPCNSHETSWRLTSTFVIPYSIFIILALGFRLNSSRLPRITAIG